jgi:hypothetical protein
MDTILMEAAAIFVVMLILIGLLVILMKLLPAQLITMFNQMIVFHALLPSMVL